MKKLFIFDIDDVMFDLKEIIHKALTEATGKDIPFQTWTTYDVDKIYDLTYAEVLEAFHKHDILRNGKLNTDIYPIIEYLRKNNIETMAVTARGWHHDGENITKAFFKDNEIGIDKVHVIKYHEKKSEYISQIKGFEIVGYIDDSYRHITETKKVCENKIGAYLLQNQPWNNHYEEESGIIRVDSMNDIPKQLDIILGADRKVAKKNGFRI